MSPHNVEVASEGRGFVLLTLPPRCASVAIIIDELRAHFGKTTDVDIETTDKGVFLRVWHEPSTENPRLSTVSVSRLSLLAVATGLGFLAANQEAIANQLRVWGYLA